jgi:hypothetical protein
MLKEALGFAPLFLTLIAGPAAAQAPAASDCVALANIIGAGQVTSLSNRALKALRYYASCEAKNSSADATIDVAYKAFSLGGTYSEAKQSELCKKSREELGFEESDYYQAKVVFDSALPTIDRCLAIAGQNWSTKFVQAGPDSISITILNTRPGGGRLLGAEGDPGITCTPSLPTREMVIDTRSIFSTTCRRTPTVVTIDGLQLRTADDAALTFRFDDGPFVVPMKGYQSSVILRLQQRVDQAMAELRTLLPNSNDFYVQPIPSARQIAKGSCAGNDILVSAACTNDGGAQAAVGPTINKNADGTYNVVCQSYNPAGRMAEGQMICLKKRY